MDRGPDLDDVSALGQEGEIQVPHLRCVPCGSPADVAGGNAKQFQSKRIVHSARVLEPNKERGWSRATYRLGANVCEVINGSEIIKHSNLEVYHTSRGQR